jgi:ABC-type transport system involved in multi-copper enzyme maturation permease subunit
MKTLKTVAISALIGAVLSGLVAGIMFGTGPTAPGASHGWALIMVPTFALVGLMMGAVWGLLLSFVRRVRQRQS